MDPDPTWKACHQHIRLATNMKFAGINIYGHANISLMWRSDLELKRNRQFWLSVWLTFSRTNHNPSSGAPYDKRKQLWKNFCIKLIWQSHHNTTSDKYMWLIKVDFEKYSVNSLQHSWNGGLVSQLAAVMVDWFPILRIRNQSGILYNGWNPGPFPI
jgi:hypothetical protein